MVCCSPRTPALGQWLSGPFTENVVNCQDAQAVKVDDQDALSNNCFILDGKLTRTNLHVRTLRVNRVPCGFGELDLASYDHKACYPEFSTEHVKTDDFQVRWSTGSGNETRNHAITFKYDPGHYLNFRGTVVDKRYRRLKHNSYPPSGHVVVVDDMGGYTTT